MAKIRVYELARDLNMNNKALLEKLSEMDISVGSHMSSLDDETVARIKATLFNKKPEAIEETRIKPSVIRRRKKRVDEEAASTKSVPEPEPELEQVEAVEQPPEKAPKGAKPVQEPAAKELPAPSAKIDEAEEPEPVIKEVSAKEAPEPETPARREEPAPEKPAALKKLPLIKKGKKAKKEAPAKIIKLPVPPRETVAEEKKPTVKAPKTLPKKIPETVKAILEITPLEKEPVEKEKQKKKWKKKPDEELKDAKFFKKKISFRRKEVVEGAALYAGDLRARKARKGAKSKVVQALKPQITVPKAIKRRIKIDDTIVLSDLAKRMGIKASEMIMKLMALGVLVTVNQTIDFETALLVAAEFNYELEKASFEEESVLKVEKDDPTKLVKRPPVVTIMGHVDHGKTSLLDAIRKTKVTEFEAGGITQHIGAYNVSTNKGQIVFLDTPGHEAFTAMRARGAKITDIVVLVVAADDGVMPQTTEAISHSRAAGVPILVAINKIDKPNADPDRVQRELSEIGLMPEDWGGDTIYVRVSAKTHQGLEDLLEMILLQAEVLELKANPDKLAFGHVVEAKLESGRGPVATVLVQEGTLRTGDPIVCGIHYGKVRAMMNDRAVPIESAGPSIPVEVIGLSGVPMAGDEFFSLSDEKNAKQVSIYRSQKQRSKDLAKTSRISLEKLYERMKEGEVKNLNLILKADVHGSIEALRDSLTKLSNEEVKINVIHSATGTISESDVSLAAVSDAIIIGFNIRPSAKVQEFANEENVQMNFYNIIYNVIKDVKDAILGMMSSTFEERVLGRAEVRLVFHVPKIGTIAGSYVTDGKVERGMPVRLLREGVICYDGKMSSLRRFKDDAKEVQSGYECGIGIENFNDIKVGDILESYYLEEIKPEFDS